MKKFDGILFVAGIFVVVLTVGKIKKFEGILLKLVDVVVGMFGVKKLNA